MVELWQLGGELRRRDDLDDKTLAAARLATVPHGRRKEREKRRLDGRTVVVGHPAREAHELRREAPAALQGYSKTSYFRIIVK